MTTTITPREAFTQLLNRATSEGSVTHEELVAIMCCVDFDIGARAGIADYFQHIAAMEIGSILSPMGREVVDMCSHWVRNRLDRKWRQEMAAAAKQRQDAPQAPLAPVSVGYVAPEPAAVPTSTRVDVNSPIPSGCLGCNHDPVAAVLKAAGMSEDLFTEVPPTRHNWGDVQRCDECGRTWLIDRRRQFDSKSTPP